MPARPAPSTLLRLASTPRWLLAASVVLLVAAAAVGLGVWQWDRTQSILEAERASQSLPIAIEDAAFEADDLPPDSIGRQVTATGTYLPSTQLAVTSREHDGRPGVWVVTGLRLAAGSLVAVVRGWLPDSTAPGSAPPTGTVEVHGVLQPDEPFYSGALTTPGTIVAIDHAQLSRLWGEPVLPGFVVLSSQAPENAPAPVPVQPTVQPGDVAFPLQNFVYAFQWWLFALFAIVVFGRWLWLEGSRIDTPGYGEAP